MKHKHRITLVDLFYAVLFVATMAYLWVVLIPEAEALSPTKHPIYRTQAYPKQLCKVLKGFGLKPKQCATAVSADDAREER